VQVSEHKVQLAGRFADQLEAELARSSSAIKYKWGEIFVAHF